MYYALVIDDDYSRYIEVCALPCKSEALARFKEFLATHYVPGKVPCPVMTDWGGKFQSDFAAFCVHKQI